MWHLCLTSCLDHLGILAVSKRYKVTNADHPNQIDENGHIPLSCVVGYYILGSLIFKDWQVDLHSETSSCMCWSHHHQVQRTLIASLIRTPTPRRRCASSEASRILWCSLSPTSSTISTSMPNVSATLLIFVRANIISSSHPSIRWSVVQASHPVANITGGSWGLVALFDPQGCPCPLAFVFFSMMASAIAQWPSCTVFSVPSTWVVLPAQLTGPSNWVQHPLHF